MLTRRKTPGLDNADQVKNIVRSLFPHVEPFQRQGRSSCVVRREELFTLEELKRAGGRLKANTAPEIDGVPNEILKEVIRAYPEILLEAFNSCVREGRFFVDWKKQRLVLLRKGNKPLGDASSYRPICLLDTMGKLLEEIILQRLQDHMVGKHGLSENQFGFRKGRSTVDAIQVVVDTKTINASLWREKRWLDSRCLKMAPEKTEALLVTDRRSFKYPKVVLGEHEIEWKKSIKYLGVQLDRRLSFGEHLQIATAKAIQCGAALTRLMPNIGGLREAKRRLVASMVNSKLLYAN